MEAEIPKTYSPESIEPRWARYWVDRALYRPSEDVSRGRFCLLIPPPNITGVLHMGHMLEHTEIDILMRWHRMRGENVLWLPGTDHASIATQMIVERELGREALPDLSGSHRDGHGQDGAVTTRAKPCLTIPCRTGYSEVSSSLAAK